MEKDPPVDTISDALRIVFATYLQDPVLALRRYRLTQRTPELREREIAWVHSYQLLFSRYLDERYREQPQGALAAEAVAASLVSVHNHVLRNWLKRGGGGDPAADLDHALGWLSRSFGLVQRGGNPRRVLVAVLDEDYDPQELTRRIDELAPELPGDRELSGGSTMRRVGEQRERDPHDVQRLARDGVALLDSARGHRSGVVLLGGGDRRCAARRAGGCRRDGIGDEGVGSDAAGAAAAVAHAAHVVQYRGRWLVRVVVLDRVDLPRRTGGVVTHTLSCSA